MQPTLRLYNTLTRTKEVFTPVDPQNVRMYVCGPTVYDYAHIGNARPVIVFDVLYRLLRQLYGEGHVRYARNLTDVDDKINARAARDFPDLPLNEAIAKVTQATTAQFHADVDALGNLRPDDEPRATGHIEEMKAIIERLIARGVAYVAEEHVLFHVPAVAGLKNAPRYGSLARRSLDEMEAGARVDVAPYKRDPMDFVLWKPSRAGIDPGWPSPAGIKTPGRPGWHIECSAMSMKTLLEPFGGGLTCDDPARNVFDIHGGGIDLVFPHHENELAQSCCAFGAAGGAARMANYWMHNGFLQVEGEKMSKSLGNFVTINELLATDTFGGRTWPGEVLRLAMLKTHYRQPIDWTVKALEEAEKTLTDWAAAAGAAEAGQVPAGVIEALADDLNTSQVLAELHALRKAGDHAGLKASLALLGIALPEVPVAEIDDVLRAKVEASIAARLAARKAKNFAESDRLRDELVAMGIVLMDGKDPATGELITSWEVKR
ncbi:Cysteine--tRNA ligase [Bosea sp. 62]|uniref:cysteine--tRNA ligase n=1 Tax=unclassified Bosea (in: a-proteobacteria) TaxID=2653178 RepID=UPI0012556C2A|nr:MULTISPECIES: cysteine--tRNA ligase [unclassified Bosea (in: a-proteobacteria)]CAD5288162.1 Cysteine--tRNA ligase [Bosea sp. 7B]CAD5300426.1 Cysteine--tRNA ligase [Bosea sp. 21B]CAD5301095.1 Cysteine--tRNA ligase [Bosea sp. 46]VVT62130.1 Cysteine--tRNA ligase [Bosea sp. EC-HK365B]VXB64293.1 Cysteine--tRNA ligase [Bosea sp. 125]